MNQSIKKKMDNSLLKIIVCPMTKGPLVWDHKKNELIWQGIGKGYIPSKRAKKEEQIKLFVNKILIQYPPQY